MTRLERLFMGLYGGPGVALFATICLCLWRGGALDLLPNNGGAGHWIFLGAWSAAAALLAFMPCARRAWCMALLIGAAGLLAAAGLGLWRSTAMGTGTGAALTALAALSLWLASLLAAARQRPPIKAALTNSRKRARRMAQVFGWTGWALALCMALWDSWHGDTRQLRGAGAAVLLVLMFVALPLLATMAAAVWRRRCAAVLALVAIGCGFLYVPGGHLLLVPPLLIVAGGALIAATAANAGRP